MENGIGSGADRSTTVLVLGASGFVGSAVVRALERAGFATRCVVRRPGSFSTKFPKTTPIALDLRSKAAASAGTWSAHLEGVGAVVNVAGVLQPARAREAWSVHRDAPRALYEACRRTGVRRVILVSAIGAEEGQTTFARSKRAGEQALEASGLDWTIVRPAVVVGAGSYGGTSLLRALAACPWRTPVPRDATVAVNTIHTDDLAQGVVNLLASERAIGQILEAAAPERHTLAEVLAAYRAWLGLPAQPVVWVPIPIARAVAAAGDAMQIPPITSTALAQARTRLAADGRAFEAQARVRARTLAETLAEQPSQTQDLWHARLFLAKPLIRCALALTWAVSGALALGHTTVREQAQAVFADAAWSAHAVSAAGAADVAIALAIARGWRPKVMSAVQIGAILAYTAVLGWTAPALWTELTGGLLKNLPLVVLVLVWRIAEEER